jgi:hypothetical protein
VQQTTAARQVNSRHYAEARTHSLSSRYQHRSTFSLHLSLPPFACLVSLSVSFCRLFILPFFYSNSCLQCSIVLFNFVSLCISLFYFSPFFYLSFPCCVSLFSVISYFPSSFFHINISIARRWCCPCNPHPNTINMNVTTTFWLRYPAIFQAANAVRR